jgi:hypothetical protein
MMAVRRLEALKVLVAVVELMQLGRQVPHQLEVMAAQGQR